MSNDLIIRLRDEERRDRQIQESGPTIWSEAADEIESLQKALRNVRGYIKDCDHQPALEEIDFALKSETGEPPLGPQPSWSLAEFAVDNNLMKRNVDRINKRDMRALRVSAEHYLWLAGHWGRLLAIIAAAGGSVEEHPTSYINILSRIRAMRSELERYEAKPLHCPNCDGDHL